MPRRQGLTGRRVSIVAAAKHRLSRLNETQEEKEERLRLQREYTRRRRAVETEEDRAQRLALDSQRRKRKRRQELRLRRRSEEQSPPPRMDEAMTARPRLDSTGVLPGRFITRPPGGILEPEITLVKSYNPGFMKFMMSIHGEAIVRDSSTMNGETADVGSSLSTSTSNSAEDGSCSYLPVRAIARTCRDYERTLRRESEEQTDAE